MRYMRLVLQGIVSCFFVFAKAHSLEADRQVSVIQRWPIAHLADT